MLHIRGGYCVAALTRHMRRRPAGTGDALPPLLSLPSSPAVLHVFDFDSTLINTHGPETGKAAFLAESACIRSGSR
jgi:hypothetical protein